MPDWAMALLDPATASSESARAEAKTEREIMMVPPVMPSLGCSRQIEYTKPNLDESAQV